MSTRIDSINTTEAKIGMRLWQNRGFSLLLSMMIMIHAYISIFISIGQLKLNDVLLFQKYMFGLYG